MEQKVLGNFEKIKGKVIWLISLSFACFHLYTAFTGSFEALYQRSIHLMFAGILAFLITPCKFKNKKVMSFCIDLFFILCIVIPIAYLIMNRKMILTRFYYVAPFTWYEYLFFSMLILGLLEGTRRKMGISLPVISSIAILYMLFGKYLPSGLGHSGFTTIQLVDTLYTTTEGIFGVALGASATFVVLFVVFGAFLEGSGIGDYFIEVAMTLTRRSVGGSAKACVIASCLLGTVSGSVIANVATTGPITIPMMKKAGYTYDFAAAVEAVASTGGQLVPPVMGSAIFIMSEMTGVPYSKILLHALIPSLLYYVAVFMMVHLEARKIGILPSKDMITGTAAVQLLKKIYLFSPLAVLVFVLAMGYSATYAVLISLGAVIVVSMFDKKTRTGVKGILNYLVTGAKNVVSVAMACACAGIVVGVINYTGAGVRISAALLSLSQNNLMLALVITAIASLVIGLGLPTTPAYIVVATLLVPAVIRMGVPVIAAHLFALYFALISNITPPVALAAFTAASIAKTNPITTAVEAFRLGMASYIVPFLFIYSPALLLIDATPLGLLRPLISSIIGISFLASASEGFFSKKLNPVQRVALLAAAALLIHPGLITDLVGFLLGMIILGPIYVANMRGKAVSRS